MAMVVNHQVEEEVEAQVQPQILPEEEEEEEVEVVMVLHNPLPEVVEQLEDHLYM